MEQLRQNEEAASIWRQILSRPLVDSIQVYSGSAGATWLSHDRPSGHVAFFAHPADLDDLDAVSCARNARLVWACGLETAKILRMRGIRDQDLVILSLPDQPGFVEDLLAACALAMEEKKGSGHPEPPAWAAHSVEPSTLHWMAPVLNYTGYARLNREALIESENLGLVTSSLDPSVNNAEFIEALEAQGPAAVAVWNQVLPRNPDATGLCLISDLPCHFEKLRRSRPAFARYAGLTMFETDRLPVGWKEDCAAMDEIWVPSSFNIETFSRSGVHEKILKRIPCGINMDKFRPGGAEPLQLEGRRRTNFLSIFEWTPRKGWDVLLRGWAKAFNALDDVSLTLKAYASGAQPGDISSRIEAFYLANGIDPSSIAPIIVVDGFLPDEVMPRLYASGDAFVLPTRGEGWGLPFLEAMACGIPAIATGWSAHLDFVKRDNGYLIDHQLVPVSSEQTALSAYYESDHHWAEPSLDHLVELMRYCQKNPTQRQQIGLKARKDVQEAWSSRQTARWIAEHASQDKPKHFPQTQVDPPKSTSRIGFDARTLSVPDSIVRGIGNYAWHHLLAILEARPGCDLTILHDDALQPPVEILEKTKRLGARWAAWSSRQASDFDLFHTPDPMHVYPGYASPFQRFGSTRVSATFHDIIPIRMYNGRIMNWPGYLARLDEVKSCHATLLCNSEFTRSDLLAETGIAFERAHAVMAGFNTSGASGKPSRAQGDALLRRLGIHKPYFLHVGAADPHKNFQTSLEAFYKVSQTRSVQFVVAGKLANSLAATRDQVVESGLQGVVFTDFLSREELEILYDRAVATLFLSRYEGFGFPALEAMACDCPVIASAAASIPEVVGDAALLHTPDDQDAICASMILLLDDQSLRQQLVEKGREQSRKFRWEDVAQKTWKIWDEMLCAPSPVPQAPPTPAKVQWVSPIWDPSGYADESREFVRYLASTDIGIGLLGWIRHSETLRQSATAKDRNLLDSLMGRELSPGYPVILDMPAWALGRVSGGGIHVGRTTFETDGLPSEWVARCNGLEEIWVPCKFNLETFRRAGVTKPILVLPEGVDTSRFRPGVEPLALPGTRKATTYLAIFEWTHRKGPDLLLQAWAQAFSKTDDVELVIRTYPANEIDGNAADWIDEQIEATLSKLGVLRSDCAPIVVLASQVSDELMPRLYAAADVYLAPSRGEGWGRPHMEAMSSGLPVIATRWSGNLEFQNDDNSWLIDIDGLEEIDSREEFEFYRGQRWASPSVEHFTQLLRLSATDLAERHRLGQRARRDMVEDWDWSKIAPLAELRIREILQGIPAKESKLPSRVDAITRSQSSVDRPELCLRWAGPVFNFSGYARLAREALCAIMAKGIEVTCDPQLNDPAFFSSLSTRPWEINRWKDLLSRAAKPGVLVVCDLPRDAVGTDILGDLRHHNPGCTKTVCWTMFETDRIPRDWAHELNQIDEVWVPSEFNRRTFAEQGVDPRKIHVVPAGIDAHPYQSAPPRPLPGNGYTFLSVFQWIERKGPDVLLDAWAKAFGPQDNVRLVLRCHRFGSAPSVSEQLDSYLAAHGLSRQNLAPIHLIEEFLPDEAMPGLFAASDCFVLPSRGEGWGIPYLEAMAAGKPVIATSWSAPTDFLNDDNSWLLSPRELVGVSLEARKECQYLSTEDHWANPDPEELAKILRHAFEHPEEGRAKGRRGARDVGSKWTPAKTASIIEQRLNVLSTQSSPSPVKPAPSVPREHIALGHLSDSLAKVAAGLKLTSPAVPRVSANLPSPSTAIGKKLSLRWEGSQFIHHSLAHVNREFSLGLSGRGHELSLVPYEADQFDPSGDPRLAPLVKMVNAKLSTPCQVHVRHQWPPNLIAPDEGRWVVVQPWEFGSPPAAWIPVFSKQVDELWAYTNHVRDMYLEAGVPPEIVKVVPLGVDCERFRPGIKPYSLNTKKSFKFLYVGGTIARKGFDSLLKAWCQAFTPQDDVCLVVKDMGGGSFYKGQTAATWIAELQASGRTAEIEYLDTDLQPSQLPGLYNACDVLVHPYRGEGFGLPIAEAMACGLPCVVTRGGAADDFCTEAESWGVAAERVLVPGGKVGPFETVADPWWLEPSVPDLVDKLRLAYTDSVTRAAKAKAAREKILGKFTWEHASRLAEERLQEVASRPARRQITPKVTRSSLSKLTKAEPPPPEVVSPKAVSPQGNDVKPDPEIEALNRLIFRAEASAARGDLLEAEHLTEEAVEKFPNQYLAWLARAMVLRGLGKFRKAIEAISQSLKVQESPEALMESLQIHVLATEMGPARKAEKALKDRHGAWYKETREAFRAKGQAWPPDALKSAGHAPKSVAPPRKGKR